MVLSSHDCLISSGSNRSLKPEGNRIFDLWGKHGLKENDFTGENLITFLNQLSF